MNVKVVYEIGSVYRYDVRDNHFSHDVVPIIIAIRTTVLPKTLTVRTKIMPIIFAIRTMVDRTMPGQREFELVPTIYVIH